VYMQARCACVRASAFDVVLYNVKLRPHDDERRCR